jgi:hypothetical protein
VTTIHRPNRPARVVLTPNAKHALTTATMRDGGYFYVTDTWCRMEMTTRELVTLHLIDDMGSANAYGQRYVLTTSGLRMRSYVQHQTILGNLAKQVKDEDIDGEALEDLARGADAGEVTGSIPGTSVDFQLAFALAASLSEQSAEDLRQDLQNYLGW